MSSRTDPAAERIDTRRIGWVGLAAIIASVIANAVVANVARALFNVPAEFTPFTWPQYTFFTVIGVGAGVGVFAVIARFARQPIRLFRIIAGLALVLSFLPDIGLLLAGEQAPFPGVNAQTVGTLMFMHLVSAAICVGLLTTLTLKKPAGQPT
jgi:hypothetical protein